MKLDNTVIKGYAFLVDVQGSLDNKDISGKSSSGATKSNGWKPKRVNVSLKIKQSNQKQLKDITELFEKDDNQTPHTYTLLDATANAMGIRQVQFTGNLAVREESGLKAWSVSFTLLEKNSTPSKKEAQAAKKKNASTTNSSKTKTASKDSKKKDPSYFEKILSKLNGLAKDHLFK
jgi:hypothetical protein